MRAPRLLSLLPILTSLACGRAWMVQQLDGGSGTDDDGTDDAPGETGDDGVATTAVGDETTTAEDGPDTGDVLCGGQDPVVVATIPYDGAALRTVAHTLARGSDGTLYMAGTRAGPNDMRMWIAASDPSGALRWEATMLPREGGNLAGWTPTVSDLYVDGDRLHFAGFTYEGHPIAWHGTASTVDGEVVWAHADDYLVWYGLAPTGQAGAEFLAGRIYSPEGYVLARVQEGEPVWGSASTEADSFEDYATTVTHDGLSVYVAGRLDGQPWLTSYTPSGRLRWEQRIYGTPVYEAEGGQLTSVAVFGGVVVAAGDLRLQKPMEDGAGSYTFNQIVVAAWTIDGDLLWTWQREADEIRPGVVHALTIDPEGGILLAGTENGIHGTPYFFAAALEIDGQLRWSIDDRTRPDDPLLSSLDGRGIAVGEPGQLWVLADDRTLGEESTTLLELCY